MFRALHASNLPSDHTFTVTVGASSKMTLASWHVLEPSDVIAVIGLLNGNEDVAEDEMETDSATGGDAKALL